MNKREIASLACKILGITTVVQGIHATASILAFSFASSNQIAFAPGSIFSFICLFVFGVLLWLFSDQISVVMFKEQANSTKAESGIKASELQNVAFSVLGLYFIGNSIPRLVSLITAYVKHNLYNSNVVLIGDLGIIAQFILGVGIFLGSRGLVAFLEIIRNAGIKKQKSDYEE